MAVDLRELHEEYASGRLTLDEFAERVGSVLRDDATVTAHLDPFDEHLVSGEKVLWVGRPDPAKRFSKADRFAIPFSLLWGGFVSRRWWTICGLHQQRPGSPRVLRHPGSRARRRSRDRAALGSA